PVALDRHPPDGGDLAAGAAVVRRPGDPQLHRHHDVRRRAGGHLYVGVHRLADPDLSRRRHRPPGNRRRGARAAGARGHGNAAAAEAAPLVEAPHLPRQALIDAHGSGGFRFAGMSHRGSLLCLPDGIWAWPVAEPAAVTETALALVFARAEALDFFVLG